MIRPIRATGLTLAALFLLAHAAGLAQTPLDDRRLHCAGISLRAGVGEEGGPHRLAGVRARHAQRLHGRGAGLHARSASPATSKTTASISRA